MKFTEILEELKKGKKVTREKWEKPGDSCAIDFIMYDQKKDKCEFYRNCTEVKYVIWYDSACKEIKINTHEYIRELPFSIYFATKKDAEKAVLTIGEDNLKKYYFDVEDNQ